MLQIFFIVIISVELFAQMFKTDNFYTWLNYWMYFKTILRTLERCHWHHYCVFVHFIWGNVFKNGPSKIYRRQPLKIWRGKADHNPSNFLKQSSTNFTWSIPEYFVPYILLYISNTFISNTEMNIKLRLEKQFHVIIT